MTTVISSTAFRGGEENWSDDMWWFEQHDALRSSCCSVGVNAAATLLLHNIVTTSLSILSILFRDGGSG
jgi:hypothetical protein